MAGGQSKSAGNGRRATVSFAPTPVPRPPVSFSGGFVCAISQGSDLRGIISRIRDIGRLVWSGNAAKAWWAITYRAHSDSISIGLRRDLTVPFTGPKAKIPLTVRPLAPTDDLSALDPAPGLSPDEAFWRLGQRRLLQSGLRTCYVAIGPDGKPCYMQWVIPASENERLRAFFGNLYPVLQPGEALLEGAYTPEAYRGKGIMGAAMAEVATRAADHGARYVITFVDQQNEASFKGCVRAGFVPYVQRLEKFRWFRRQVAFTPILSTGTESSPARS
jgi:RimJ/RimL family protein N-acetyltransferase